MINIQRTIFTARRHCCKRCQLSSVARLSHWASTFVCSTFAVM